MDKILAVCILASMFAGSKVLAADVVPTDIMQPGTQPNEVQNLESPDKCDNCHGGYDEARIYSNEPAFGWRGSAMGNAGRDPIFWATLAIAEQDFDGSGDLCIRCHSAGGWYAGRSTPTDGSGLQAADDNGVDCDTCHKATNPDNSEHFGVMNTGFEAFDPVTGEGYYGSGILSIWGSADKLGPYNDAQARHQWMQSNFHRSDLCGSCHDVSNPAVGDLAPNNGAQEPLDPATYNGIPNALDPGQDPTTKAAFNNPPYAYGIVERTFSEWKSGALDDMDVRNFVNLPPEMQVESGALNMAYQSAMLAGGTYEDGTIRTFSCQSCHMRPDIGEGCNKAGVPTRSDLPKHDLTGGNYWIWPLIRYQDQQGTLRLGGGLTSTQLAAMDAGQLRGEDQLGMAANLQVSGDNVTITNLTGHKLITGYPEGRRMWLNIKWYDLNGDLIREDGEYGPLPGVSATYTATDGTTTTFTPESLLDLDGTNTRIYEAHYAMTQDWATKLIDAAGYDPALPLSFDRTTGEVDARLGQLKNGTVPHGSYHETFHFVLNNYVAKDNRIPPYGMEYDVAKTRNALPVPANQYSDPGPGGTYNNWDTVNLNPPLDAEFADITLYYQGTSWEYIQFLWKANNGTNAFLGQEGVNMLDAWVKTGMVPPFAMATATWGTPLCTVTEPTEATCDDGIDNDCDGLIDLGDPDCQCTPTEPTEITCNDGIDNDCDGAVDAADPDCLSTACTDYTIKSDCNNDANCTWQGSPNNGSCFDAAGCTPTASAETGLCGDGIDNDCDGTIDCADVDCGAEPVCQVNCLVYTTRNLCNSQSACSWDNKNKVCIRL